MNSSRFTSCPEGILNLGYTTSTCWTRFTVNNTLDEDALWFLRINYFQISLLELYIPENGSFAVARSGTDIPFSQWCYRNEKHVFQVSQHPGISTYYLKARSRYGSLFLPMTVMSKESLYGKISLDYGINGMFYGMLAAFLLFSILILLSARQILYFYYILYILAISFTILAFDGLGFKLIWPDIPEMNRSFFMILTVCVIVTLFSKEFLSIDRRLPLLGKIMNVNMSASVAASLLYFIVPAWMPHISVIMTTITSLLCLASGVIMLVQHERAARFYVLSWSILFAGAIGRGVMGILGSPLLFHHELIIKASLGIQIITFSLALTDRINLLRKELNMKMAEQKRMEKKLQQKNEELEATNEELQAAMEELEATNQEFEAQNNELIESQSELEKSEKLFRGIFENSPYSITITRRDNSNFVMVNKAFERFLGYTEAEVLGKSWNDLNLNIEFEHFQNGVDQLQKGSKIENMLARVINREGQEIYSIFSSIPVDFQGEPCFLSMTVDITKTRKLEEQLRQSQKMEVIGKLAGGVAHDFNNMLAGILGSAEMLAEKYRHDPEIQEYIKIIGEAASRAGDLTRKLLVFSRKEPAVKKKIDAHEPVKSAISLLERSFDRRIGINVDLKATDREIEGDASLLQNVFMNLGINARDAMPDGGTLAFASSNVVLEKEYCAALPFTCEPGHYIEISVSDTGTGMTREVMERMYEPFFTTKEAGKGTGLGLSIVYAAIQEHGGAISVYSDPGRGTLVRIFLPLCAKAVCADDDRSVRTVTGSGLILVVDDEEMIRKLLTDMLSSLGYEVITADNGIQALEIFMREKERISLVILDLIMPKMNGTKTFTHMREIDPSVKVLFSSGFNRDDEIYNRSDIVPDGFLQKPYGIADLSRIVAEIIGRKK